MKSLVLRGIGLVGLVLVAGCSSLTNIAVRSDGGADITLDLQIQPIFASYVRDLQEALGAGKELFNLKELQTRLAAEPGATIRSVTAKDANLKLDISVKSVAALAGQKSSLRDILSLTAEGGNQVLRVRLSQKAVQSLIGFFAPAKGGALESVLPGKTMTSAKYEEQLLWALEDYGSKKDLQTMLRAAKIQAAIILPTPPKSVVGGSVDPGNPRLVRFEIGILELMTLSAERVYEVRY